MGNWENQWIDYYEVLGIERNASIKQIKKKYHKLMSKYHPDVYTGEDGKEKVLLINEAYEVLSNSEKKKIYDLEYDRRLEPETAKSNNNFTSAEENMDDYTKEEQQYAKMMAMKVVVEEELEKANVVIDTKNQIIYSAYEENIDKYAYYKNVKEFATTANEYIKELYDLCELCDKYELFSEIETINEVIVFLEGNIKAIPLSPSDAIRFMKTESRKENLMNRGITIKSKIEESIQDIENLFHCVYQKQISHIEFNTFSESVLINAKDVISSSREFVLCLSRDDLEIPELENALGKLGALIQTWPEDYEAASQIGKCIAMNNSFNDILSQYQEYTQKTEKIIKMIKRHPVNHHVEMLYNYSKQLSQEIMKKLSTAMNNNHLGQNVQEILEKAYSLSSEGEKIYQSSNESSKKADEIYETKHTYSYNNKEIQVLLKQAVNQFDKGKSLELLKEAGYYLNIFNETDILYNDWIQMPKILNSNINTVKQYNKKLDEMMETIRTIIQNYQSVMNNGVNQQAKQFKNILSKSAIYFIIAIIISFPVMNIEEFLFALGISFSAGFLDNLLIYKKASQDLNEEYRKRYMNLKEGKVL